MTYDLRTNGALIVPDASCADEIAKKIIRQYAYLGIKVREIERIGSGISPRVLIEVNGATASEEIMLVWRDSRDEQVHYIMARHYCFNRMSYWMCRDGSKPAFANGGVVWVNAERYHA